MSTFPGSLAGASKGRCGGIMVIILWHLQSVANDNPADSLPHSLTGGYLSRTVLQWQFSDCFIGTNLTLFQIIPHSLHQSRHLGLYDSRQKVEKHCWHSSVWVLEGDQSRPRWLEALKEVVQTSEDQRGRYPLNHWPNQELLSKSQKWFRPRRSYWWCNGRATIDVGFSLRHLLLLLSTGFSAYCVCSAEGQEFILAGKKIMYLYEQEMLFK